MGDTQLDAADKRVVVEQDRQVWSPAEFVAQFQRRNLALGLKRCLVPYITGRVRFITRRQKLLLFPQRPFNVLLSVARGIAGILKLNCRVAKPRLAGANRHVTRIKKVAIALKRGDGDGAP